MISLIKASFVAPYRVLAQGFEATIQSVSPFAFLVGAGVLLAAFWIVAEYLETGVDR